MLASVNRATIFLTLAVAGLWTTAMADDAVGESSDTTVVELTVSDFRRKMPRRFWAMIVTGDTSDGPWSGGLTVKQIGKKKVISGSIPTGIQNARLKLKSPSGHALVFQRTGSGRRQASPVVDLGSVKEMVEGTLSFYDAAYIQVRVKSKGGKPVPDATVVASIRSAPIEEYRHAFQRSQQDAKAGVFVGPAMVGPLAFAGVTVSHATLGKKRLAVGELERGETRVVDITLDGTVSDDKSEPSKFMAESERILPGRALSAAERELKFGATVKGLRAAALFDPNNTKRRVGESINVRIVIHNASEEAIAFSTLHHLRNVAKMNATDVDGHTLDLVDARMLLGGRALHAHYRLKPGDAIDLPAHSIGIGAEAKDEKRSQDNLLNLVAGESFRLSFEVPLPGIQIQDGKGNLLVPAEGEWIGTLTTDEVEFQVVAPK